MRNVFEYYPQKTNNYDYVILIDENGQSYIAHSLWGNVRSSAKQAYGSAKRSARAVHKYLLKVGEGAKAQYAYTKEEADRLMGRGKRAINKAVSDVKYKTRKILGVGEKELVERARKNRKDADKIWMDKEAPKRTYLHAKEMLKTANNADDKRKASSEMRIARREYNEKDLQKAQDNYSDANDKYKEALKRYSETPIELIKAGRFKDAIKRVDDILKDDHTTRLVGREKYITDNTTGPTHKREPVPEDLLGDKTASGGSLQVAKDKAKIVENIREGYKAYKEREEAFKQYDDARTKAKIARAEANKYLKAMNDDFHEYIQTGTFPHDGNWAVGMQQAYDRAKENAEKLEKEADHYHDLFVQAQDRYGALSAQSKKDEELYKRYGVTVSSQ